MKATNVGGIGFDKNLNKFQNFKQCVHKINPKCLENANTPIRENIVFNYVFDALYLYFYVFDYVFESICYSIMYSMAFVSSHDSFGPSTMIIHNSS